MEKEELEELLKLYKKWLGEPEFYNYAELVTIERIEEQIKDKN